MKGFLKFLALVALFIPVWIALPMIWGEETPQKPARFGVLSAIEEALAATGEQREVSSVVRLEPNARSDTWSLEGSSAVSEQLGVVSAQPFAAKLHTSCRRYIETKCWVVDQLDFPVIGDVAPDQPVPESDSDDDVEQERLFVVQTQLNAMGFDIGPADGVMGPRTRQAIEDYAARIEADGDADEATDVVTILEVMGRLARGVDRHKQGNIHSAMHEYAKVLQLDPNNTSARFNRGLVYRHVGATDLAITEFDETLKLRRDHEEGLYERGNAYYEKKEYWAALTDYADGFGWRLLGYRYAALRDQFVKIRDRASPEFEAILRWAEAAWDGAKDAIAEMSRHSDETAIEEAS